MDLDHFQDKRLKYLQPNLLNRTNSSYTIFLTFFIRYFSHPHTFPHFLSSLILNLHLPFLFHSVSPSNYPSHLITLKYSCRVSLSSIARFSPSLSSYFTFSRSLPRALISAHAVSLAI